MTTEFRQPPCRTLPPGPASGFLMAEKLAMRLLTSWVQPNNDAISSSAAGLSWAHMRSHAVLTLRGELGVWNDSAEVGHTERRRAPAYSLIISHFSRKSKISLLGPWHPLPMQPLPQPASQPSACIR